MNIHEHWILILDFGSQYTQLIARRIREMGVFCEIHAYDADMDQIIAHPPKGIILSGGPESVLEVDTPRIPEILFHIKVPILGICYGMQALAAQLGGAVESSVLREFGYAQVALSACQSTLLAQIEDHIDEAGIAHLDVWMSHGDRVSVLPPGFMTIAATADCPIAGMADEQRCFYGVQFHPEVTHTRQGERILARFVLTICACEALWTPENIISDSISRIRQQIGPEQVLLAVSGGVDSAVVAALLHKAIGSQLTCVFVDNGLLRYHEGDQVMATLADHMGVRVLRINTEERFLNALSGIVDPEEKRKRIGNLFIQIFEEQAEQLNAIQWLAQGTIYPDVIESAGAKTGKAHVIKSHHNVGGLPATMRLKLLEPLRELFKDEVRQLGVKLGLPYDMVYRHPFPGPGLAVRVLGEVKAAYLQPLRQADAIFIEELRQAGWYEKVSQAFVVFLPVKAVGVVGDQRQYAFVVSLRAVETIDFMTAHWAELPYSLLDKISRRIINEVPEIARVVYDISGKPPATIEWE